MLIRRNFLQGLLALLGGLLLPFRTAQALTDVDKVILSVSREDLFRERYRLTAIQVHRLLYNRMNLRSIEGVRIQPTDGVPDQNGYIRYYWMTFNEGQVFVGCKLRSSSLERWTQCQLGQREALHTSIVKD